MASPETGTTAKTTPLGSDDPRELGSYTLLGKLGQGGMGTVYLGRSERGRLVAIKVIRADVADDREFRNRFRLEAETARRVARVCTAEVLDADPEAEQPYLVTEFIEGKTLAKWVSQYGPLADANLEQLAVGMASALTAIHSAGIVHRDLKPSNVVLSPFGPRVIDFGIARALDAVTNLTGDMQQLGTPAFMSPEQIEGGTITPAADVFAWGGVVTFAATGRFPFGDGNAQVLLYRALHEEPRLDGVDSALHPIVWHAMRKDPANRPSAQQLMLRLLGESPSAPTEEVQAEATQLLADWRLPSVSTNPTGPTSLVPNTRTSGPDDPTRINPGSTQQGAAPPTPYPATVQGGPPPAKKRSGKMMALVAAGVAAILIAAALIVPSLGGDDPDPPGTANTAGPTEFTLPAAATPLSIDTVVYASKRGDFHQIVSGRIGDASLVDTGSLTEDHVIAANPEADLLIPIITKDRKTVIYYRATTPAALIAIAADGTGDPVELLAQGEAANLSVGDEARPSVSPDGRFMVLRSTTNAVGDAQPGLYVVKFSDSTVRRLDNAAPTASDPAWSPNADRIAYWSSKSGNGEGGFIVTLSLEEDAEPNRITPDDGTVLDADPAWSYDGSSIVFRRALPNEEIRELYYISPDGGDAHQLTNLSGVTQDPAFSPRFEGNAFFLAFVADAADGDRELFMMTNPLRSEPVTSLTADNGVTQLTVRGGNDTHVRWNFG